MLPMLWGKTRPEPPYWGLAAFCLVSPLSIAATNAAWVAALLLWLRQVWARRSCGAPALRPTPLDRGFLLLGLASLLSLCTSLAPWASLVEMRSLGLIVVYYLFAGNVRTPEQRRFLVMCLLGSTSLAAFYGIGQYVTGRDLFGHYDPRTNLIGGFFSMHLTFGEYLVLVICLAAGILLHGKPGRPLRLAAAGALAVMLPALVLSWAKGAFLGLVAGVSVLFVLKGKKQFGALLAVILGVLLFFAAWNSGSLFREVVSLYGVDASQVEGTAKSNTQRLFMWWSGLGISAGHFVNGVGMHAVNAVYPDFRHPLAQEPNQWHLHNNFLQLGVETGLFGLAAFIYLFLLAFRAAWGRFRAGPDPWERGLSAGLLAILPAFLVSGLTEYSWADSEVLMALYMLLGLALPAGGAEASAKAREPARERVSSPVASSAARWSPGETPSFPMATVPDRRHPGGPGKRSSSPGASCAVRRPPGETLCSPGAFVTARGFLRWGWFQGRTPGDRAPRTSAPDAGLRGRPVDHGIIPSMLLALLLLSLIPLSFAAGGKADTTGARFLALAAGAALAGLPAVSPGHRLGTVSLRAQLAAWLTVFAGYRFTQPWWAAAGSWDCGQPAVLLSMACLVLMGVVPLLVWRAGRESSTAAPGLFDVATFAAAWVWAGTALGTGLLLRLATGRGGVLEPPVQTLLLLCALLVLLYGAVRALYRATRLQDVSLAVLGLFLCLHALR